jgi:serine/threonine protein kinase
MEPLDLQCVIDTLESIVDQLFPQQSLAGVSSSTTTSANSKKKKAKNNKVHKNVTSELPLAITITPDVSRKVTKDMEKITIIVSNLSKFKERLPTDLLQELQEKSFTLLRKLLRQEFLQVDINIPMMKDCILKLICSVFYFSCRTLFMNATEFFDRVLAITGVVAKPSIETDIVRIAVYCQTTEELSVEETISLSDWLILKADQIDEYSLSRLWHCFANNDDELSITISDPIGVKAICQILKTVRALSRYVPTADKAIPWYRDEHFSLSIIQCLERMMNSSTRDEEVIERLLEEMLASFTQGPNEPYELVLTDAQETLFLDIMKTYLYQPAALLICQIDAIGWACMSDNYEFGDYVFWLLKYYEHVEDKLNVLLHCTEIELQASCSASKFLPSREKKILLCETMFALLKVYTCGDERVSSSIDVVKGVALVLGQLKITNNELVSENILLLFQTMQLSCSDESGKGKLIVKGLLDYIRDDLGITLEVIKATPKIVERLVDILVKLWPLIDRDKETICDLQLLSKWLCAVLETAEQKIQVCSDERFLNFCLGVLTSKHSDVKQWSMLQTTLAIVMRLCSEPQNIDRIGAIESIGQVMLHILCDINSSGYKEMCKNLAADDCHPALQLASVMRILGAHEVVVNQIQSNDVYPSILASTFVNFNLEVSMMIEWSKAMFVMWPLLSPSFLNQFSADQHIIAALMKTLVKNHLNAELIVPVCKLIELCAEVNHDFHIAVLKVPSGCKLLLSLLSHHISHEDVVQSVTKVLVTVTKDNEVQQCKPVRLAIAQVKGCWTALLTALKRYQSKLSTVKLICELLHLFVNDSDFNGISEWSNVMNCRQLFFDILMLHYKDIRSSTEDVMLVAYLLHLYGMVQIELTDNGVSLETLITGLMQVLQTIAWDERSVSLMVYLLNELIDQNGEEVGKFITEFPHCWQILFQTRRNISNTHEILLKVNKLIKTLIFVHHHDRIVISQGDLLLEAIVNIDRVGWMHLEHITLTTQLFELCLVGETAMRIREGFKQGSYNSVILLILTGFNICHEMESPDGALHLWKFFHNLQKNHSDIFDAFINNNDFVSVLIYSLGNLSTLLILDHQDDSLSVEPAFVVVEKMLQRIKDRQELLPTDLTLTQFDQLAKVLSVSSKPSFLRIAIIRNIVRVLCTLPCNRILLSQSATFFENIVCLISDMAKINQLPVLFDMWRLALSDDEGVMERSQTYLSGCRSLLLLLLSIDTNSQTSLVLEILGVLELTVKKLSLIHQPFEAIFKPKNSNDLLRSLPKLLVAFVNADSDATVFALIHKLMDFILPSLSIARRKICWEPLFTYLTNQLKESPFDMAINDREKILVDIFMSISENDTNKVDDPQLMFLAKQLATSRINHTSIQKYNKECLDSTVITTFWHRLLRRQATINQSTNQHYVQRVATITFDILEYFFVRQFEKEIASTLEFLVHVSEIYPSIMIEDRINSLTLVYCMLQRNLAVMIADDNVEREQNRILFEAILKFLPALFARLEDIKEDAENIVLCLWHCLKEFKNDPMLILSLCKTLSELIMIVNRLTVINPEIGTKYRKVIASELGEILLLLLLYQKHLNLIDNICKLFVAFNGQPYTNYVFPSSDLLLEVIEENQIQTVLPEAIWRALLFCELEDDDIRRVIDIVVNALKAVYANPGCLMWLFECLTQSNQVIERVRALIMDNVTYRQAVVDMMRFNAREDSSNDASMFVYIDKWLSYETSGDENPLLSILGDTDGFCETLVACIDRHNEPCYARIVMGKMLLYLLKCDSKAPETLLNMKQLPVSLIKVFDGTHYFPDAVSCLGAITGQVIVLMLKHDNGESVVKALNNIPQCLDMILGILHQSVSQMELSSWLQILHAVVSFSAHESRDLSSKNDVFDIFDNNCNLWVEVLEHYKHDYEICNTMCNILKVFSEPSYLVHPKENSSHRVLNTLVQQLVLLIKYSDRIELNPTFTENVCCAICGFMQNHCYFTLSHDASQFCLHHLLQALFADVDPPTGIMVVPPWFELNEQHVLDVLHILLQHHRENNISCSIDVMQQMYVLLKQYRKDGYVVMSICQVLSVYSQCVISDNKTFTEMHNVSLLMHLMRMHKSQSSVVCAVAGLLQILLEVHGREMSDYLMNEPVWTSVWLDVLIGQQRNKQAVETLCCILHSLLDINTNAIMVKSTRDRIDEFIFLLFSILRRYALERNIVISTCEGLRMFVETAPNKDLVKLETGYELLQALTVTHQNDNHAREIIQNLQIILKGPKGQDDTPVNTTLPSANKTTVDVAQHSQYTLIANKNISVMSRKDVDLYKGTWKQTPIVIKAKQPLDESSESQKNINNMWLHELQTMSKLRHPHIVTLLGCCLDFDPSASLHIPVSPTIALSGGINALVLEYMEKGDLRSLLTADHVRMSLIEKLHIALDVSEGMRFLHESDIFHRDLKSVYVLIDRHGRAKLTGFGGGDSGWRDVKGNNKVYRRNEASSTPVALSTFCIADSDQKELLRHADIYAFGVIVWELITGKVPWTTPFTAKKTNKSKLAVTEEEERQCPKSLSILMNRCFESAAVSNNSTGSNGHRSSAGNGWNDFSTICETLALIVNEEQQRLRDKEKLIPDGFICPITQDVMRDPVMLMDGHSYERKAIIDWLKRSIRSPLTNEELPRAGRHGDAPLMLDNYALKAVIEGFYVQRGL